MSYEEKLECFKVIFEKHHQERQKRLYPELLPDVVRTETGYKFDKVFVIQGADNPSGRYMVENRTGKIYGIKSWTQVNKRRQYGTLETVDQFDWSEFYARPLPGTDAEREHVERETTIKSTQKKRGRKSNASKLA